MNTGVPCGNLALLLASTTDIVLRNNWIIVDQSKYAGYWYQDVETSENGLS
jgi:hypothetical protein